MVAPSIDYKQIGPLPVFPLPDFVLFPSVQTSLFIFEPRFCRMVEDCIDADGLFCMTAYEHHPAASMGREPAFFSTGCLTRLLDYERHLDGSYTIMIQGLTRVAMREVEGYHGYRQVTAQPISLHGRDQVDTERETRVRRLAGALSPAGGSSDIFTRWLDSLELEELLGELAFHGLASLKRRQHLLESTSLPGLCDEVIDLYKVHH